MYRSRVNRLMGPLNKMTADKVAMFVGAIHTTWGVMRPYVASGYNSAGYETTRVTRFRLTNDRESTTTLDAMLPKVTGKTP